jgi:YgiT-type zinc finger domain-containing protein
MVLSVLRQDIQRGIGEKMLRQCPKCGDKMMREPSLDEKIEQEGGCATIFTALAFICRSCGTIDFEQPETPWTE